MGFDAGDYNLYRYVGNDPLDKTDPMGLEYIDNVKSETVERIPGNLLGQTQPIARITTEKQEDGRYVNRFDVIIVRRLVAEKAKYHGKEINRTQAQMDATREHEEVYHREDWKAFHDAHQASRPETKFSGPKLAKDAAQKEKQEVTKEMIKANKEFNKHEPRSRWDRVRLREVP